MIYWRTKYEKCATQRDDLVAALDALFKESSELSPFAGKASVRSVRQAGKFMKAWRNARDVLAKTSASCASTTPMDRTRIVFFARTKNERRNAMVAKKKSKPKPKPKGKGKQMPVY